MFEVWFDYRGVRRWRGADDIEQRDAAVAALQETEGVTDINVIEVV